MWAEASLGLDFFVLFASRQKEHKRKVRTPLSYCEALAEQIKNKCVSEYWNKVIWVTPRALARKHV
jgi:hypothetical protein